MFGRARTGIFVRGSVTCLVKSFLRRFAAETQALPLEAGGQRLGTVKI
jgi:hypothetical protein